MYNMIPLIHENKRILNNFLRYGLRKIKGLHRQKRRSEKRPLGPGSCMAVTTCAHFLAGIPSRPFRL